MVRVSPSAYSYEVFSCIKIDQRKAREREFYTFDENRRRAAGMLMNLLDLLCAIKIKARSGAGEWITTGLSCDHTACPQQRSLRGSKLRITQTNKEKPTACVFHRVYRQERGHLSPLQAVDRGIFYCVGSNNRRSCTHARNRTNRRTHSPTDGASKRWPK